MDCGPTCIRMVAKYYGRTYSLQNLRERSQINREGVSLLGLSEAAESIGFHSLGAKLSFETLANEISLPCIVHWKQNHFVVVYKISSRPSSLLGRFRPRDPAEEYYKIHVADPSHGLITYSRQEFSREWLNGDPHAGIALLLETTPRFFEEHEEQTQHKLGFSQLFGYLLSTRYRRLLVQLVLGLFVGSLLQLILPFLTQSIVDVGINTQNLNFVYLVLGAQLMLTAGRVSIDFIRSWILLHISSRINVTILSDFLSKLMRLPLAFFDVKQFGDLMQRIEDQHRIESFLTNSSLATLLSLFNLLIFGAVLALYNLPIFLIFLVGTVLYGGWIALFLHRRRNLDFKRFEVSSQNQSSLAQLIQGMQEIKLSNSETYQRWRWERIQARLFKFNISVLALNQYQQTGAFLLNEGKNIFISFFAARAVIKGDLTLGAMLAVQYIIGQLNSPAEQIVAFIQTAQAAQLSLERLNEIQAMPDEEPVDQPRVLALPNDRSLQLKQVSFAYPGAGDQPVLQNITLHIPPGKVTAIVGASGSGKTTLLKLLLKFYTPTSGEVCVGETRLTNLSHKLWRSQCGVVMQEGFIFSDTVAHNIAVGEEIIDYERLQHAMHIANIQDFIASLPLGYNTKIGLEGNGMSQGQRQRLLIARAVYKDPGYLFFDEATNALDANNESIILRNLDEFFHGRTVVVVAHRLSTVRSAHQIVVLDKGQIVEIGAHEELAKKQGAYYRLVKNQLELGN
jgi:ATP-binding cassette subfamily B protein